MSKTPSPNTFVATCGGCLNHVGAADVKRTDRADLGKLLGQWLFAGLTVQPRWGDTVVVEIKGCECPTPDQRVRRYFAL